MLSFSNLLSRMPGAAAQGIIYGLLAIGVYITFRILQVSDLTVDGTFSTGGAVTAMLILAGWNNILAVLVAALVGALCGFVTGILHTKLKIPAILSGILVQFGLYSINLRIMDLSANVALNPSIVDLFVSMRFIPKTILILAVVSAVVIAILYWYFGTAQGSALRSTGCNENMSIAQGINTNAMKVIGLALSNGIVALAGGLMAQYQGYADVNMGRGAIVFGLATLVIGESVLKLFTKKDANFAIKLAACIVGGIIYYAFMSVILWLRVDSSDLRLFTAILVAVFLAIPNLKVSKPKKGDKKC